MLARALEYINSHYEEDIKIKELADWCHISETHFRRMFSAYTSMSPLEYINQIRIKNACEYLKKQMILSELSQQNADLPPILHLTAISGTFWE